MARQKRQQSSAKCPSKVKRQTLDPAKFPVPRPHLTKLKGPSKTKSPAKLERDVLKDAKRMTQLWGQCAPAYRVKGIRLKELQERSKNDKTDISSLNEVIEDMKSGAADECSGKWFDEEGNLLFVAFANRIPSEGDSLEYRANFETSFYPGPKGRTTADVEKANKVIYEGLPSWILERAHQATQTLASALHPVASDRDIRHPDDRVMEYPAEADTEYTREGVQLRPVVGERTGVLHLAHAWRQQGHTKGTFTPSKDMLRGCNSGMEARRYFIATRPLAIYLGEMFKVSFPAYYEKYRAAFAAGVWFTEDPGPWIARAIVYKLQVDTHVDGLDDGPTAVFNFGYYTGGELYLPDLRLKLQYRPGHVMIFLSGQVYHHVAEWKPTLSPLASGLSPGRIGNVFFFPQASYEKLKGRPSRWNIVTSSGISPDATR